MRILNVVLVALCLAGILATCSSCSGSDSKADAPEVTEDVTFHVIGMKKAVSGAT